MIERKSLRKSKKEKKINSAILGFIVGDCLGVPFEFTKSNSISKLEMVGFGTHWQPPGTWSDDTAFMMASIDSDQTVEGIRLNMLKVLGGEYTCDNILFDKGRTTISALLNPNMVNDDIYTNGNGSLMRIVNTAIVDMEIMERFGYIRDISAITHPHEYSIVSCFIYSEVLRLALDGDFNFLINAKKALDWVKTNIGLSNYWNTLNLEDSLLNIDKSGFVVESLKIILNICDNSITFKAAMIKAINLGGDTDTHCALIGSLMALKDKIPPGLVKKVRNLDKVYLN